MKRHHIVGIIAGICAIGLAVRSVLGSNRALAENIIGVVVSFTLLSGVTIPTFFKDRLPSRWSQEIIPIWTRIVVVSLLFLEFLVFNPLP